jgi:hypothetical protein
MPENLIAHAAKARARHAKRHANPGVVVELQDINDSGHRFGSPHSDVDAWQAMVCDALGTRSDSTALAFLSHLTQLCERTWHADAEQGGGVWAPDEGQLNMVLNMVAGIKPKNEMQAALAAQMVAVHLMSMKVAERCLKTTLCADPHLLSAASKLTRTFAIQTDALARMQGRRISRQKITVSYEKHEHQHVHVTRGDDDEIGGQPHAKRPADALVTALPGADTSEADLPLTSRKRQARLPDARRE